MKVLFIALPFLIFPLFTQASVCQQECMLGKKQGEECCGGKGSFAYHTVSDASKVIIYKNGEFFIRPVAALAEEEITRRVPKKLGRNIKIDRALLNKLFGKDI